MTHPSLRTHTDALVALLDAGLPAGVLVGDGEIPAGAGWAGMPGQSDFVGYVVVHPLGAAIGLDDHATLAAPDDDGDLTWQLTCVGASRSHAEAVTDLVFGVVIGAHLTVAGRATTRLHQIDISGGARRDEDDTQPPLWIATPRITCTSTPA